MFQGCLPVHLSCHSCPQARIGGKGSEDKRAAYAQRSARHDSLCNQQIRVTQKMPQRILWLPPLLRSLLKACKPGKSALIAVFKNITGPFSSPLYPLPDFVFLSNPFPPGTSQCICLFYLPLSASKLQDSRDFILSAFSKACLLPHT